MYKRQNNIQLKSKMKGRRNKQIIQFEYLLRRYILYSHNTYTLYVFVHVLHVLYTYECVRVWYPSLKNHLKCFLSSDFASRLLKQVVPGLRTGQRAPVLIASSSANPGPSLPVSPHQPPPPPTARLCPHTQLPDDRARPHVRAEVPDALAHAVHERPVRALEHRVEMEEEQHAAVCRYERQRHRQVDDHLNDQLWSRRALDERAEEQRHYRVHNNRYPCDILVHSAHHIHSICLSSEIRIRVWREIRGFCEDLNATLQRGFS